MFQLYVTSSIITKNHQVLLIFATYYFAPKKILCVCLWNVPLACSFSKASSNLFSRANSLLLCRNKNTFLSCYGMYLLELILLCFCVFLLSLSLSQITWSSEMTLNSLKNCSQYFKRIQKFCRFSTPFFSLIEPPFTSFCVLHSLLFMTRFCLIFHLQFRIILAHL